MSVLTVCCPAQSRFKAQKFACKQRSALLVLLYQCAQAARSSLRLPVAPKLITCVPDPCSASSQL